MDVEAGKYHTFDSVTSQQAGAEVEGKGKSQPRLERASSSRFKVLGHMVVALKRLTNALNPSYTYGKSTSDTTDQGPKHMPPRIPVPKGRSMSSGPALPTAGSAYANAKTLSNWQQRASSGRTSSGRPQSAGKQHGYKGNLLFKQLPNSSKVAA